MRDHVLTYAKNPEYFETTSKRPTIIDFISKIKKRSVQTNKDDDDSKDEFTGIAEILVTEQSILKSATINRELEEEASHRFQL